MSDDALVCHCSTPWSKAMNPDSELDPPPRIRCLTRGNLAGHLVRLQGHSQTFSLRIGIRRSWSKRDRIRAIPQVRPSAVRIRS